MPSPREDLISSAVTFLQDPSVASSSIDKRKAFLESKNLTAEEIDLAFARAGTNSPIPNAANQSYYPPQQQGPPPQAYGYNYPPYPNQWVQQTPPPPRRDWRDWFIMATVTTGVSWTLYTLAKRYVMPMIAPPTPPQIEQDKSAIDAEFAKAFALIDQLAADTAELKTAEDSRKEKLDSALQEVEDVIAELKQANKRREDDASRIQDEVKALRNLIPQSLDAWKAEGDKGLKELATELKSLKMLVSNRVGGNMPPAPKTSSNGTNAPTGSSSTSTSTTEQTHESSSSSTTAASVRSPVGNFSRSDGARSPFSFEGRSGRAIPDWQKAAAEKSVPSPTVTNGDASEERTA